MNLSINNRYIFFKHIINIRIPSIAIVYRVIYETFFFNRVNKTNGIAISVEYKESTGGENVIKPDIKLTARVLLNIPYLVTNSYKFQKIIISIHSFALL